MSQNLMSMPSDYYGTGRGLNSLEGLVFFPYRWKVPGNALSGPVETSAAPPASTLVQPDDNQGEFLNRTGRTSIVLFDESAMLPSQ